MHKYDGVLKDTDTDKEKLKLCRANERVYYKLMTAYQGTKSFVIVERSVTPKEDMNLAWKGLKERFYLQMPSNKLKLKKCL